MNKKYPIQVLRNANFWGEEGELIETTHCVLKAESIGNFNPIFCTYKGEKHLVKSKQGDISDPFRREESYLNSLFINIKET